MTQTAELAPAGTVEVVDQSRHLYRPTVEISETEVLSYFLYHVTTLAELDYCCDWMEEQTLIALDTETSGLDPVNGDQLATIQVGNPFAETPAAFVVDYRLFTREQLARFFTLIADPKRVKLGQNIKFECRFITYWTGTRIRNVIDTQVAEMIIRAGLLPTKKTGDVGEASRIGYSACSMAALCQRYLGIGIDKDHDLRTSFYTTPPGTYTTRQLVYAASDVVYPFYIYRRQQEEIEARKLASVVNIEFQMVPILAEAELRGMMLDTRAWRALYQEAVQRRADAERKLHALLRDSQQREMFDAQPDQKMLYPKTGKVLNFDSTDQIKWALKAYCESTGWKHKLVTDKRALTSLKRKYGESYLSQRYDRQLQRGHMLPPFAQWVGREVDFVPDYLIPGDQYCVLMSTNAPTLRLAKIKGQLPRELVDLLLEYAKYSIRADTFGVEFINKYVRADGRIHTEFHQALTSTGRLSTTPNLQNIPKDARYRKAFIAAPGYKFVIADYSQQEPRLTAQETLDPVYLRTYQNNEDIYLNAAEALLGYRPNPDDPDPVVAEKAKQDRHIMKTIVLAMAYRMGVPKLQNQLTLALEQYILEGKAEIPTYEYVKELHERFLRTFANLRAYQEKCSNDAHPTDTKRPKIWDRYLNAPVTWATARCGRKRFFRPDAEDTYTAASNAPIQGCAATMSKAAAVLIQRHIDAHGIDGGLVDAVHDELVYEIREDQAAEFALVMQQLMEKAGDYWLPDVGIKAEFPKNTNGVVDYWAKEIALEEVAA
jgi:DNA polymerase I-like protein with 3'-5' exonuclease and polymerase domains